MSSVETLADQAFQLPERDRADLAYRLLRSLEPAGEEVTEEESQAAWAAEIKARSDAVHAGTAELRDAREAIGQIRESLDEKWSRA